MHRPTLRLLVLPLALAAPILAPGCGDGGGGETCAAGVAAGELVISELLADPEGADADGVEWFELYNSTDRAIKLTGIGLEVSKVDGSEADGHRIPDGELEIGPGEYLTFGRIADDQRPPHIDYGFGADLQMGNDTGKLRIVCGATVVDEHDYEDIEEGKTHSLDGKIAPPDAEVNDDPARWCSASEADMYSDLEYGTPGAANGECPLPQPLCGQCYDGEQLRDAVAPRPGQLVISEVMANAKTDDAIGEWFEVHVTDGPVDLNCVSYGTNVQLFMDDDPKALKTLNAPECLTVQAGEFLVFAQEEWDGADFPLDLSLVDSPGSNANPGVFLVVDGAILDEVHYPKPDDGVAWSLDPDLETANDDPASWCDAATEFGDGSLGSPGEENPQCPLPDVPGQCLDGDTLRDINYLQPGELLITEVFPDPGPMVADAELAEWFELYIGADRDLNGLTFGKTIDSLVVTVAVQPCIELTAGQFVLIAASDDAAGNGMLPAPDFFDDGFALTNDNSTLLVAVENVRDMTTTELDATAWNSTADGAATQFPLALIPPVGDDFDVAINDDPTKWCNATSAFGVGDLGTPKAANTACDGPVDPGMCTDPVTMDLRAPVSPGPGAVVITEFMPNPNAVSDADGEWFELFITADFDLNGLELGKLAPTVNETITDAFCLPVSAGDFILLAKPGTPADPPDPLDPAGDGGLPPPDWQLGSLSLSNSNTGLFVGHGGVVLDEIAYNTTTAGAATQLTADCADPACNDDPANWCPATEPYGLGDLGTPRAANAACDGGPPPGGCTDPVSGDQRDPIPPPADAVVITEFMANPNAVADADGEWFELLINAPFDLNGLELGKVPPAISETITDDFCLPVVAGDRVLLAVNGTPADPPDPLDPAGDGGLPTPDRRLLTLTLTNSNSGLFVGHAGGVLDAITYAATAAGKSTQLTTTCVDTTCNDDPANWCSAAAPYGLGDLGTPDEENMPCP